MRSSLFCPPFPAICLPFCSIFQMLWDRGEPIIVRGLRGSMGWTPEAMGRVCKESNRLAGPSGKRCVL